MDMLEGVNINLRVMEPEDIPLIHEWMDNVDIQGRYTPFAQKSLHERKKAFNESSEDQKLFIIEKKDETRIGIIFYFKVKGGPYNLLEIGYLIDIAERKKGYCTEAVKIFVDFLFLSMDIPRIQAATDKRNKSSQRVLEKANFSQEGIIRKSLFMKGELVDTVLFSIIRDDWKEPKILKI